MKETPTPHRTNERGTFLLDRRCGPLGRVRVASGTSDAVTFRQLNDMLTRLKRERRWDLLGLLLPPSSLEPLELYDAITQGRLHTLPSADDVRGLAGAVATWLEQMDLSAATKRSHRGNMDGLLKVGPTATLGQLPELLGRAKRAALESGKRQTFRNYRISALSLLRDVVGREHRLYLAVRKIDELKVTVRKGNPQTPDQVRALVGRMPQAATEVWGLALTGMRRGEFWGSWDVWPDRIAVHGTKSEAAERVVPRVFPIGRPVLTYDQFVKLLRATSDETLTPHDLRKTFMNWMEDAGIPRTRRKIYLGHEVADVSDLYERRDVTRHLAEDGDRLRAFLGEPPAQRLEVAK